MKRSSPSSNSRGGKRQRIISYFPVAKRASGPEKAGNEKENVENPVVRSKSQHLGSINKRGENARAFGRLLNFVPIPSKSGASHPNGGGPLDGLLGRLTLRQTSSCGGTVSSRPSACRVNAFSKRPVPPTERVLGLGDMAHLPNDVMFRLFNVCELSSLSVLARSSQYMRQLLLSYVAGRPQSFIAHNRIAPDTRFCLAHNSTHDNKRTVTHESWGSFLKSLSINLPPGQRIKMLQEFYEQNHSMPSRLTTAHTVSAEAALFTHDWGAVLRAFVSHWGYAECERAFNAVMEWSKNRARVFTGVMLKERIGGRPADEMLLRVFYRNMFLRLDDSYPFYLSLVVNNVANVVTGCVSRYSQAKFLCILYCPLSRDGNNIRVDWQTLVNQQVVSLGDARLRLGDMIRAADGLSRTRALDVRPQLCWHSKDLFVFFEEVTTFPEPWALDNFAALLLFVPVLARVMIGTRVTSGQFGEAAAIVNAMKTLYFRWLKEPLAVRMDKSPPPPVPVRDALAQLQRDGHAEVGRVDVNNNDNDNDNDNNNDNARARRQDAALLPDEMHAPHEHQAHARTTPPLPFVIDFVSLLQSVLDEATPVQRSDMYLALVNAHKIKVDELLHDQFPEAQLDLLEELSTFQQLVTRMSTYWRVRLHAGLVRGVDLELDDDDDMDLDDADDDHDD